MTARLATARRIGVKIGSSTLVAPDGAPQRAWLADLAADIAALKKRGAEVLVVSSGAIALGRRKFKLGAGALKLRYDHNLLNLQADGLESVALERKLLSECSQSMWYAVSMADNRDELLARKAELEAAL